MDFMDSEYVTPEMHAKEELSRGVGLFDRGDAFGTPKEEGWSLNPISS